MSARLEALALERELLVARCALDRLRLRHGAQVLRDSLSWQGIAVTAATTRPARRLAFDLALSFVGERRATRAVALARRALSLARLLRALAGPTEIATLTTPPSATGEVILDLAAAEQCIQKKAVVYDAEGDAHSDTISAFIKSMRGSDPDATLYWLAKMIHAGEDPRFIARRIVIHAAEDVGLADPVALVLANADFQAAEFIGWPEARIPIAEAALYFATAP